MSLLDPKHLLAPFRNKTHLFTLIGVVLVFGLFRYLGGGVTTEAPSSLSKVSSLFEKDSVDEETLDEDLENTDSEILIDSKSEVEIDEEVTKAVKSSQKRNINPPSKKDTESEKETSELDEIEKAMGLR